ncbi:MAG TPA: FAD-dependent oxidoreductase [Pirellulales bacterium]|nr:FAD-dependent oxidoreductase [Pirellulales bacterium]
MAVDTPARIAIVGAGPMGLEAALYARFLGYDVDIYERGEVAENVLRWGHVKLFTPWRQNVSPLAVAALTTQDADWRPPDDEAILTGREFAARYLLPLARCDLLIDGLHTRTEVVALGREGHLKGDHVGAEARIEADFRLLLRDAAGAESIAAADVVIDAGGTFGNHNWAGASGIPAPGEIAAADAIEYGLPDVSGRDRERYTAKTTLLVGDGYSAATSVVALAELARQQPGTQTIWITRRHREGAGPVPLLENDRLAERDRLARAANALAGGASAAVEYRPGTVIDAIHRDAATSRLSVRLSGIQAGTVDVDRIIANVGYRPDTRLYSELQVHQCYASDGPMKLAAALLGQTSADCLDQTSLGPSTLVNPEPDFYILGSKSYGRNSRFLFSVGLAQIRDLFSIIGDRADLDLYRVFGPSGRL